MSINSWMEFALDDLESGEILLRESKFNMACFHAQQAAEKALKGYLVFNQISSPRIHNLVELINLCGKIDDGFYGFKTKMATLNQFYAPTRYPDAVVGIAPVGMPNKELARRALDYANDVVMFCKAKMQ